MKTPYSIPSSIEKRLQTWNEWTQQQDKDDKILRPCITISREFGCQAYPLAETLYKRLNKLAEDKEEWILLEPQRSGINWLVWGLPFVALALGGVLAVLLVRKWAASGSEPTDGSEAASALSAENEAWLQEALRDG